MAATIPASAPQNTLSAKFASVYLNGIKVAKVTDIEAGMAYDGTWDQCVGEDRATWNPDKRTGSGTLNRMTVPGNKLSDILIALGQGTAQQLVNGDLDLRFIPFTFVIPYQDGLKTTTRTLFDVQITKESRKYEGNRLMLDSVIFEYPAEGEA